MKRTPTEPKGFYKLRREPRIHRKASGKVEVQTYAISSDGELVFAGVNHVAAIDARAAYSILRHWRRWRSWYDSLPWNRRADYPAKHCKPIARIVLFPVNSPALQRQFSA